MPSSDALIKTPSLFEGPSWPALECLLPALLRIVELHRGWVEGLRVKRAPGPPQR
jgi:hypothetical protein